jgi:hypothetical protein
MAVIKEWNCPEHGYFAGSHPLCPAMGCVCEDITRAFLTAPGVISATTKNNDAGLRDIATSYGLSDLRSAREGEAAAPPNPAAALWGTQHIGPQMMEQAKQPWVGRNARGQELRADNIGMRAAAQAFGVDKRPLPPAQAIGVKGDSPAAVISQ